MTLMAAPAPEPEVPNVELVATTDIGVTGAHITIRETFEDRARNFAYLSGADIALIRPIVPRRSMQYIARVEAWRTKGYQGEIIDEPAVLGFTLLPPPGTPFNARNQNIKECLEQARSPSSPDLSEQEKSVLAGRDTRPFLRGEMPAVDKSLRPLQDRSVLAPLRTSAAFSDRYVLCLMNRGYQWPQPGR